MIRRSDSLTRNTFMNYHIITIFPDIFNAYLGESILGRAIKEKKIKVSFVNPRKYASGKYKHKWPDGNMRAQVDDRPYGGGPGMVIQALPILKSVEEILKKIRKKNKLNNKQNTETKKQTTKTLIINFIPSASKFTTNEAKKISKKYTDIILICGRYEGIDARVDKILKTKRYSIGDYVLTGGEIPAMILIDTISRQIEGVLGNFNSREEERISSSEVYTRPEILEWPPSSKTSAGRRKKYRVPKVLLRGNHKEIENWKKKK
jgi:tRNA (guanine37-N1)-methyltransferase